MASAPKPFPPLSKLLPHREPMILIDRMVDDDGVSVSSELTIRATSPFFDADSNGVPSYVGIEYMAQTCGARLGTEAQQSGVEVKVGLLLGTRNFETSVAVFTAGAVLTVRAEETMRQGAMVVFDCTISQQGETLASAQVNIYQPALAVPPGISVADAAR